MLFPFLTVISICQMYLHLMIFVQTIAKQTDKKRPDWRGSRIPIRELKYQQTAENEWFTCCHSNTVMSYSFQAFLRVSCSLCLLRRNLYEGEFPRDLPSWKGHTQSRKRPSKLGLFCLQPNECQAFYKVLFWVFFPCKLGKLWESPQVPSTYKRVDFIRPLDI